MNEILTVERKVLEKNDAIAAANRARFAARRACSC